MIEDSELRIDSEGIFVTCFQGAARLWEFHPDDVTSVGVYREDELVHEVIATLNKDFDVPAATRGLKELNERLSRQLKTTLLLDDRRGSSPLGVILWPSYLEGSPLWEFWILGEDGLARYVSPGAPGALRNTSRAVCREMARTSKPRLPEGFPNPLIARGFSYHGAIGWHGEDAVMAAKWLHGKGAAILDAELWMIKNGSVQPHILTSNGPVAYHWWTTTQPSETWQAFANRSLDGAVEFMQGFNWPEDAAEFFSQDVRFCISWVWQEWLEEDDFRFPI